MKPTLVYPLYLKELKTKLRTVRMSNKSSEILPNHQTRLTTTATFYVDFLCHTLPLSLFLPFSFSSCPLDHRCSLESSRCFSSQICWVQFDGRLGQLGSRAIKFGYFQALHLILLRLFGNLVTHNPKAASCAEPQFLAFFNFHFHSFLTQSC